MTKHTITVQIELSEHGAQSRDSTLQAIIEGIVRNATEDYGIREYEDGVPVGDGGYDGPFVIHAEAKATVQGPPAEPEEEEGAKLVRVSWFHTETFERVFRVPEDFDPGDEDSTELLDQIANLDQEDLTEAFEGCTEREITEVTPIE